MQGPTGMPMQGGIFDSSTLQKYITRLPRPQPSQPLCENKFRIAMVETKHIFHPQLGLTNVWFYNGLAVPMLEVCRGKDIYVQWANDLPKKHLLSDAIDPTIMGAEPNLPAVRNAVHLHGGEQAPFSDG